MEGATSIRMLRQLIQKCFNKTADDLLKKDEKEEDKPMKFDTVHWLSRTSTSDDINKYGLVIHAIGKVTPLWP